MLNTGASSSSDQSLSVKTSFSVNSSSMATFVLWCIYEVLLCVLVKGILLVSEYLKFKKNSITSFLLFCISYIFISLQSDSISFFLLLSGDLNILLFFSISYSFLLLILICTISKYFKIATSLIFGTWGPLIFSKKNFFGRHSGYLGWGPDNRCNRLQSIKRGMKRLALFWSSWRNLW